jgi:hypothetical protein
MLFFDLPGHTTVEIEAGISITATTVWETLPVAWQGPVALVIHNDPDPRFRLVRVERP